MIAMPNTNTDTGIPYGYINLNSLSNDVITELEQLPNPSLDEQLVEYARNALLYGSGTLLKGKSDYTREEVDSMTDMDAIDALTDTREYDAFWDGADVLDGAEGSVDGVLVHVSELGGTYIVAIIESPHTGRYVPCNPCLPGAGDLDSPSEDGMLCYDVPSDWRASDD